MLSAKDIIRNAHPGFTGALLVLAFGAIMLAMVASTAKLHCRTGTAVTIGHHAVCLEIAETPTALALGLGGRSQLPEGQGMLFVFSQAKTRVFWMRGMEFPLDMIWIRDHHVVGFETNVAADGGVRRISTPPVDAVIELNAGDVARFGIAVGDAIRR